MPDAVARFAGFAAGYDAVRPRPPAELAEVLLQWSGAAAPDVVDVGAGTGLSAAIWAGLARDVVAVEAGEGSRGGGGPEIPRAGARPRAAPGSRSRPGAPRRRACPMAARTS
jgi:hypothetical protein